MRATLREDVRPITRGRAEPRPAPVTARAALTPLLASALGNQRVAALVAAERPTATVRRAAGPTLARLADVDLIEWQDSLKTHEHLRQHPDLTPIWAGLMGQDPMFKPDTLVNLAAKAVIERLRDTLIAQDDIQAVTAAVRAGLPQEKISPQEVARVKAYEFSSGRILFSAENFVAWKRLATGQATVDDLRFFLHELTSVRRAGQRADVTQPAADEDEWDDLYDVTHHQALIVEMRYLAGLATQEGFAASWQEVAVSDAERWEEFLPALHEQEGDGSPVNPSNMAALRQTYAKYLKPQLGTRLTMIKAANAPVTAAYEEGEAQEGSQPVPMLLPPQGAVTLPNRGELVGMNQRHDPQSGVHSDNFSGWETMARREQTLAATAAVYVFNIVRGHAFNDGNKRTGEDALHWIAQRNGSLLRGNLQPLLLKAADLKTGYTAPMMAADLKQRFRTRKKLVL